MNVAWEKVKVWALHSSPDKFHTVAAMDPYSPLPTKQHIRLLTINTSHPTLSVSLIALPLHKAPSYIALSYAWGIPGPTHALPVPGHCIEVQVNLYRALQSLRARRLQSLLWIDALCINQSGAKEKSHQIPLMRDIYSQASTVLIWLGDASKIEEAALRALPKIVDALDRTTARIVECTSLPVRKDGQSLC